MPQVYLHYFGNESSESILEAYGLKPSVTQKDKLKPVTCPNCGTDNKIDSKFCSSCKLALTLQASLEAEEEKESEIKGLKDKYDRMESKFDQILSMIQQNPKLAKVKKEVLGNF